MAGRRPLDRRSALVLAVCVSALITAACAEPPANGEVSSVAFDVRARSLDPARERATVLEELWELLYARIVRVEPTDGSIAPEIAEAWEVAADGLTWRFYLRPDVRFHTGRPIVALDVVKSLRRLLDPRLGAAAGELLYAIAGARELHTAAVPVDAPLGISAVGDLVVEIALESPAAYLPAVLASVGHVVGVETDGVSLSGEQSGPFSIAEQVDGGLVLDRNEHYRLSLESALSGILETRSVRVVFTGSTNRALQSFDRGEVTAMVTDSPLTSGVGARFGDDVLVSKKPLPVVHHLQFSTVRPPTDEAAVRRALAQSLGTDVWTAVQSTSAMSPIGVFPPGTVATPAVRQRGANPGLARHLLVMSAAGALSPVILGSNRTLRNEALLHRISEAWEDSLGLTVETREYPRGEYFAAIESGRLNAFRVGHRAPYRDAHATAISLFHSRRGVNWVGVVDPRVDALIGRGATTYDTIERRAIYRDLESILVDDLAVVVPLYGHNRLIVSRR